MDDPILDLKSRARILHRQARRLDPAALSRLRTLPELRNLEDGSQVDCLKRRHCLAVIARELGFEGWPHARAVLAGTASEDFGTLLYPPGADVHWNIWSANYEEARDLREQIGGYLLAYRRHFFVVDRHFIETLGLDPDDHDWELLGRNWVKPLRLGARRRLYAKLIRNSRWAADTATRQEGSSRRARS